MDRDKMKIIDFGMDESRPPRGTSATGASSGPAMKIVDFDGDSGHDRKHRVNTGHVKIVEFNDDEPEARLENRPATAEKRPAPKVRLGPIKIREFGREEETRPRYTKGKAPQIKIMEFD